MIFITSIITSAEWVKLRDAAAKQFSNETLSRGEICRGYVLYGMESLKNVSPADQARRAYGFQASMEASDERLKH